MNMIVRMHTVLLARPTINKTGQTYSHSLSSVDSSRSMYTTEGISTRFGSRAFIGSNISPINVVVGNVQLKKSCVSFVFDAILSSVKFSKISVVISMLFVEVFGNGYNN